jgi:hypothetical protein
MKMLLSAIVMALVSLPIFADPVWSCVTETHESGKGRILGNRCTGKLHVSVCIANDTHFWKCPSGGLIVIDTKPYPLPDTKEYRGQIFYAACAYPATPQGWDGRSSIGYRCK